MKKSSLILLCCILLLSVLTACSNNTNLVEYQETVPTSPATVMTEETIAETEEPTETNNTIDPISTFPTEIDIESYKAWYQDIIVDEWQVNEEDNEMMYSETAHTADNISITITYYGTQYSGVTFGIPYVSVEDLTEKAISLLKVHLSRGLTTDETASLGEAAKLLAYNPDDISSISNMDQLGDPYFYYEGENHTAFLVCR